MLRRKQLQKSNEKTNKEYFSKSFTTLGDDHSKGAVESLLEEEVLAVGENVIDALPSIVIDDKRRKRKRQWNEVKEVKKWSDSDEEDDEKFTKITPDWAKTLDDEESEDSDEETLKACSHYSIAPSHTLPSSSLEFKRVTDANKEDPSKNCIKSIEFHPKSPVLLVGGVDQTVKLFMIDGKSNKKMHSIFFEQYPVFCTHFSCSCEEIIVGSSTKHFRVYDMEGQKGITVRPKIKGSEISASKFFVSPNGKFLVFLGVKGNIYLFSQKSKELIETFEINIKFNDVCFSQDGETMYAFGETGEVYMWNLNQRNIMHHFTDDGCLMGTCISVSPDNNYVVCGSSSGIVNVYDRETTLASRQPKPLKVIKNLTTKCSNVQFNSKSEILAIHSKDVEKGIRLVHVPSFTAFPNYPDQFDHDQKLLSCMDFSPASGYFALGNNKGRCLLYRLQHYSNY